MVTFFISYYITAKQVSSRWVVDLDARTVAKWYFSDFNVKQITMCRIMQLILRNYENYESYENVHYDLASIM